jgi:hypothetical protein
MTRNTSILEVVPMDVHDVEHIVKNEIRICGMSRKSSAMFRCARPSLSKRGFGVCIRLRFVLKSPN